MFFFTNQESLGHQTSATSSLEGAKIYKGPKNFNGGSKKLAQQSILRIGNDLKFFLKPLVIRSESQNSQNR
jgi:hypothetical protein